MSSELGTEVSIEETAKSGSVFLCKKEVVSSGFKESQRRLQILTTRKKTVTFSFG